MSLDYIRRLSWINEFDNLMGINMAYSKIVPTSVLMFKDAIKTHNISINSILDVGCGRGRIGLHLARLGYYVTGIDYVPSALDDFTAHAKKYGLGNHVEVKEFDLSGSWNVSDLSMDAVFAITVIENLITANDIDNFRKEVGRILRKGGIFALEWYTPADDYYRGLPMVDGSQEGMVVFDPKNNITFRLFTDEEVIKWLGSNYNVLDKKTMHFKSEKYGATYNRETKIMIFRRDMK